jgi:hypothetical protein
MQKWEYKIVYLGGVEPNNYDALVSDMVNHYGAQGWELVAVDRFRHYFKRPVSD